MSTGPKRGFRCPVDAAYTWSEIDVNAEELYKIKGEGATGHCFTLAGEDTFCRVDGKGNKQMEVNSCRTG